MLSTGEGDGSAIEAAMIEEHENLILSGDGVFFIYDVAVGRPDVEAFSCGRGGIGHKGKLSERLCDLTDVFDEGETGDFGGHGRIGCVFIELGEAVFSHVAEVDGDLLLVAFRNGTGSRVEALG